MSGFFKDSITENKNELANSIFSQLVSKSIVKCEDVVVFDQKLVIHNLPNYSGKYFFDKNNDCTIRCFNKTPELVAIICDYTLDTKISEVKKVERFLKDTLNDIGYIVIDI
jgi:hypothetical protein